MTKTTQNQISPMSLVIGAGLASEEAIITRTQNYYQNVVVTLNCLTTIMQKLLQKESDTADCKIDLTFGTSYGQIDPNTGLLNRDDTRVAVFEEPEDGHNYNVAFIDLHNIIPNQEYEVSGRGTIQGYRSQSNQAVITGMVGRPLYKDANKTPFADTDDLTNATAFYSMGVTTTPSKHDVVTLTEGGKRYFNGTDWQDNKCYEYNGIEAYLNKRTTNLEEEYASLAADIATIKGQIQALQGANNTVSSGLGAVNSSLGTLYENMEALEQNANAIYSSNTQRLTSIEKSLATYSSLIEGHIKQDLVVYNGIYSEIVRIAKEVYEGYVPVMDESNPTVIYDGGSLVNLATLGSRTVEQNGYVVISYKALLGVAPSVSILRNGETVPETIDYSLLSILGSGLPSEPIQVSTGDVISVTGTLELGSAFTMTFYPNLPPETTEE